MPADHKVSVAWQIVALFIPIANFWAFYRIKRLRKYVLYVMLPSVILSIVATYRVFSVLPQGYLSGDNALAFGDPFAVYQDPVYLTSISISWALFGFSIYLVVMWSREHNNKFNSQTLPTA